MEVSLTVRPFLVYYLKESNHPRSQCLNVWNGYSGWSLKYGCHQLTTPTHHLQQKCVC